MRLLNTHTLTLEYFPGETPSYAILSHRWEEEELTFRDIPSEDSTKSLKGFSKVNRSAIEARKRGYDYIWIDTCCIDKSSSAELSEAINSMFQWYQGSTCCFVYMSDVTSKHELSTSRWFSRGWTLQELVAPSEVQFFDRNWISIGTKQSLSTELEKVTGISSNILLGADLGAVPVCNKLSWASERTTTRQEDIAYCLLGLLGVNMPLLYGEGSKRTFQRLQEEFIRQSDDETIFAWTGTTEEVNEKPYWGLLAPSPLYFKNSGSYTVPYFKTNRDGRPTEVTNRGLGISFALQQVDGDASETQYLAPLNCSTNNKHDIQSAFTITLQKLSPFESQYARVRPDQITPMSVSPSVSHPTTPTSQFYVRSAPRQADPVAGFCFNSQQSVSFTFKTNTFHGTVTLPGRVDAFFEEDRAVPSSKRVNDQHHFICLSIENTGINPEMLYPDQLRNRVVLGFLKLRLSGWFGREAQEGQHNDHATIYDQVQPRQSYQDPLLVVGFEPLPSNPLGTPSGFIRLWYSFTTTSERQVLDKFTSPDVEPDLFHTAPGGTKVAMKFFTATRNFRTFYDTCIVNTNNQ